MRIGELAQRAGTSPRMLRYYEQQGLLAARRSVNGYREYDETDLRLVREIRSLLDRGFNLEETRPFVECLRSGRASGAECPESMAVLGRKLADLDDTIARLTAVRGILQRQLCGAGGDAPECGGGELMSLDSVTDASFADEVLASDVPVLVDFWAEWCPPCHLLAPVLERLATEYAGRVRIVKLDADANPESVLTYGVMSMPTLLVFHRGQVVSRHVGTAPTVKLRELLDAALASAPAS